jgi:putative membrane protein
MNLSKYVKLLLLGISLASGISAVVYAQDLSKSQINSDEKSSLATIAAIDKSEILVSIVAENKNVNADVIDYAKMMITQHGKNLTQILEMAKQLKTGLLSSGKAEQLSQQSKQTLFTLGALEGSEFAHAYADGMVKGHQSALNLIDTKLLKTAKSEEIKKFLTDTRTVVAEHLEHAKKLQEQLNA